MADREVGSQPTVLEGDYDTLIIPVSVSGTAKDMSMSDIFAYLISEIETEYSIRFGADGILYLWNADEGGYMSIQAENNSVGDEELNLNNI